MIIHVYDWGDIAAWFSGIGSFLAAIVALVLATRDNRIKIDIKIFMNRTKTFDFEKNNDHTYYDVCITNLRARTVNIRSIGFYKRKILKKKRISKATSSDAATLASVAYGEMMTKEISFSKDTLMRFTELESHEMKKLYIGIEDISGKIHYKKFTP